MTSIQNAWHLVLAMESMSIALAGVRSAPYGHSLFSSCTPQRSSSFRITSPSTPRYKTTNLREDSERQTDSTLHLHWHHTQAFWVRDSRTRRTTLLRCTCTVGACRRTHSWQYTMWNNSRHMFAHSRNLATVFQKTQLSILSSKRCSKMSIACWETGTAWTNSRK